MASQSADPPAPQSQVVTTTAANGPARVNAYTDVGLTKRNVTGSVAASDLPPESGSTTLGGIRPVYANDKVEDIDNDAAATANANVDPPPHSPNSWQIGTVDGRKVSRDPYANQGMVGQPFFNHQTG